MTIDAQALHPTVVFGADHSPWTQAVVLAAAACGHRVQLKPCPTPRYFFAFGFVMPACTWSDGSTTADSLRIIRQLSTASNPPFPDAPNADTDFAKLEKLFFAYSIHRTGPGRRWGFFRGWSLIRDHPTSFLSITARALLFWYFFALIEAGRRILLRGRSDQPREDRLSKMLSEWDTRLIDSPFLDGAHPGPTDFGLLGNMECMSSGLTDWAMHAVIDHPALTNWLKSMHDRLEGHPTLYSRRIHDADRSPQPASRWAQLYFGVSAVAWLGLFPISLPVLFWAFSRRKRAPHRSGGRLQTEHQKTQ